MRSIYQMIFYSVSNKHSAIKAKVNFFSSLDLFTDIPMTEMFWWNDIVLPAKIKNDVNTFSLRVGPPASESLTKENHSVLKQAIANQKKIDIIYRSEDNKENRRIVWPFTIGYCTDGRILVAWCEKQKNYRQ